MVYTQTECSPIDWETEKILAQAKIHRCHCRQNEEGSWQILPPISSARWQLQQADDLWILLLGDVPQVKLHPGEVHALLRRQG
ncbi:MAG: hypothetical protein WBA24_18700 [Geitlerinemataceae cyanobacterium]